MKKTSLLLALLMLIFVFVSCGEAKENGKDGRVKIEDYMTDSLILGCALPTAKPYQPDPAMNPTYDGYKFEILNANSFDGIYTFLDPDMTGEVFDDTCFERNLMAEERFDIFIGETAKPVSEIAEYAKNIILSEEHVYDVMYLPITSITSMLSEELFQDLLTIDELNISNVWWDQPLIIENIIEDRLFFATSDLHLMAMETAQCIFFNVDALVSLGLNLPYNSALNGEWTLHEMKMHVVTANDYRGSEPLLGFSVSENAKYLPFAMDARLVKRDDNGRYSLTADSDSNYISVLKSLAELLSEHNVKIESEEDSFATFLNGGSLFLQTEIRRGREIKESGMNFGILPLPKNSVEQETYYSPVSPDCLALCIPSTNKVLERTGNIIDYLTYESYRSLMPRYYDITVSRKALGGLESIDILALIRGTRTIEPVYSYGWIGESENWLSELKEGSLYDFAELYKERISSAIEKTYETYPTLQTDN